MLEASFHSVCTECGGMIHKGDPIVTNDDGQWVHRRCGTPTTGDGRQFCPECGMIANHIAGGACRDCRHDRE